MIPDLTDAERDTLRDTHAWPGERSVQDDVEAEVARIMAKASEQIENRVMRLAAFSAIARAALDARDDLLDDLLAARYRWTQNAHDAGDLRALAWQDYELNALARALGLTRATLSRRARRIAQDTYHEALRARTEATS